MNDHKRLKQRLGELDEIISDPLRFKAKLGIGEDAYTSISIKNKISDFWDVAGTAATTASMASSPAVASTFFSTSGVLSLFGLGAAVTPVGWVIAAGVAGGGAWYGIRRAIRNATHDRVTVIPKFINTPMDILALGLFDLMGPLALKVAVIDGEVAEAERKHIESYFIKEWGYNSEFIQSATAITEASLTEISIKDISQALAILQKENKDCNYEVMTREILNFLVGVTEADGRLDEREEMAIDRIQAVFLETNKLNITGKVTSVGKALASRFKHPKE